MALRSYLELEEKGELPRDMTVKELSEWLKDFPFESDCNIIEKIIVTTPDQAKYIFSNEGDET